MMTVWHVDDSYPLMLLNATITPSHATGGEYAPGVRVTDGIRGAMSAGVRLFGGGVFVGASRAVDHAAPWRALVVIGQAW
jgi:hypothetical protein